MAKRPPLVMLGRIVRHNSPAMLTDQMVAEHEQSETVKTDAGYQNVYGRKTPKAEQPLPLAHDFEQPAYADEANAVAAAVLRSRIHGVAQEFIGRSLPGRRR